ncbi:MAG TPA: hypothetical protein VGI67_17865 [Thermoleophilaceae bacterium]
MIKRLLFLASTVCTVVVVLSFGMFAVEEANASSTAQQTKVKTLDGTDLTPQQEKARAKKHTKAREAIDDANDVLTKPFDSVANSSNIWVERGVPALLAFLLYFVVLRVLAGYAVKLRV